MAEFDVRGQWRARQSNGFTVNFNLEQDVNSNLSGRGPVTAGTMRGTVEGGKVEGNFFVVTVDWDPSGPSSGARGEYSGMFNPEGRITGITVDLNNPGSQAGWFSDKQFSRTF